MTDELLWMIEEWISDCVMAMDAGSPYPSENTGKWLLCALSDVRQGKDPSFSIDQARERMEAAGKEYPGEAAR